MGQTEHLKASVGTRTQFPPFYFVPLDNGSLLNIRKSCQAFLFAALVVSDPFSIHLIDKVARYCSSLELD